MGFLDELRQELAASKAAGTTVETPLNAQAEALAPLMRALHKQLARLAAHLNLRGPKVTVSYDVQSYGRLADLTQDDYVVSKTSGGEHGDVITLSYDCHGERPLHFWTGTTLERDIQKSFLESQGLHFRIEQQDEWRFGFTVDPYVPVSYAFQSHPKAPGLQLTVRNYARLGETRYGLPAEKVTAALLDAFARHVVRKPNRFDELAGFSVPNEVRRQLQARVARRQMAREAAVQRATGEAPRAPRAAGKPKAPPPPPPPYAWVVTGDPGGDTSATLGRLGPAGATQAFTVGKVLASGRQFRLRDSEGNIKFMGQISGKFTGREPLEDFGRNNGCVSIEYEENGHSKALGGTPPPRSRSA